MTSLDKIIQPLLHVIRFEKRKIFFVAFFTIVFGIVMFPFEDLADLVGSIVADKSQGAFYLNSEDASLSIMPMGLRLEKVTIDTPQLSELKIGTLTMSLYLPSWLAFNQGYGFYAKDIFDGDIRLSFREKGSGKSGHPKVKIEGDLSNLAAEKILGQMESIISIPIQWTGKISGDLDSLIDLGWVEPPTAKMNLRIAPLRLEQQSVATPLGPVQIPGIRISELSLSAQMQTHQIQLAKVTLGKDDDELSGTVSGEIKYQLSPQTDSMAPQFKMGGYDLMVKFSVTPELASKMHLFLSFLDGYKKSSTPRVVYSFRMLASSGQDLPRLINQ